MKEGHVLYAKSQDGLLLKLQGEVRFMHCAGLEKLIKKIIASEKIVPFYIDVTEATMVDSTALGLLAQIAMAEEKFLHKKAILVCHQSDVKHIIMNVGLDKIFYMTSDVTEPVSGWHLLSGDAEDEHAVTERVLSAHKTLSELDSESQDVFQDLVERLETQQHDKKL